MTTTIVSPNPLPSDIDWAQVATVLDIKIVERRTLSDVVADAEPAPYTFGDYVRDHPEFGVDVSARALADGDDLGERDYRSVECGERESSDDRSIVSDRALPQTLLELVAVLDETRELVFKVADALSGHGDSCSLVCENSKGTARDGAAARTAPYSTSEASRLIDIASAELKRVLRDTGREVIR